MGESPCLPWKVDIVIGIGRLGGVVVGRRRSLTSRHGVGLQTISNRVLLSRYWAGRSHAVGVDRYQQGTCCLRYRAGHDQWHVRNATVQGIVIVIRQARAIPWVSTGIIWMLSSGWCRL